MRYINSDGKKQYILDRYSHTDSVQYEASEYWMLNLYVITLDDVDDVFSSSVQRYMILEYPSYTEMNYENKINDCIWSVPYMAYLFPKSGTKRYKTVAEIKKFYEEQISTHRKILEELENYRFYHMGISNYEKHSGEHYIEYKISPRQPDKWKCYYIQEYYITNIDSLGLLNLTDPEGLHSYRYYPLVSQSCGNQDYCFAGKNLASNVQYILKNSYNCLNQYSNKVYKDILRYKVKGIVFKMDVVGFTIMYNKVVNEMHSLDETGKEIAVRFIAGLSNIFETKMQEFGIPQFIVEGDGVTGLLPLKDMSETNIGVDLILKCIEQIKKDINILASKVGKNVCLRCSLAVGDCIYGKLAGLSSSKQVAGEIMILISRMDQYLQSYIRDCASFTNWGIILNINKSLFAYCPDLFNVNNYSKLTEQDKYREIDIHSILFYKEV